ncbi:MAG: histidine kinase [Acidobacteriota bacterium]
MPDRPSRAWALVCTARFWWLNAAGWLLVAVILTGAVYTDYSRAGVEAPPWLQLFLQNAVYYGPWALLTPGVFLWVERFPLTRGGWRRRGPVYVLLLGAWLLFYVPSTAVLQAVLVRGSISEVGEVLRTSRVNGWVSDSVYLLMLVGIASAWEQAGVARRRTREAARLAVDNAELAARLADARLDMLRSQLEPHFLWNALNSINALIRTGEPERATRAIGLLSELLRYAVHAASNDRVPLGEEVDFAEAYLGFQQLRYGDRLTTCLEVDPAAVASATLPPLVLQPLLENAVRHGVERLEGPSRVTLTVRALDGDGLGIEVRNSPGSTLVGSGGLGIGLTNVRARLEHLYGDGFQLRLRSEPDGFVAELTLPRGTKETAP